MSINRWMDKEDVVHIYNGILLSHKKEWNWVICRDMEGLRDCHTEWSKSEREKQISYINAYMWNLEKRYRWTYLQSRNRDTDVENKRMDTKEREGEWDELGDWDWHVYTAMYGGETSESLLYRAGKSTWCSVVSYMGGKSRREGNSAYLWLIHFAVQQKLA